MNKYTLSYLFFLMSGLALSLAFNNCGIQEGGVLSKESTGSYCVDKPYRKRSKARFDILNKSSVFLTPADGDWTSSQGDNLRSEQIYLDVLNVDEAHQIVYEGISSSIEPVVVAVIDSGVDYNHPDLVNQIYRREGEIVGYDFFNKDTDPMDENGHGTHVAGLIAAEGHNGLGVRGGAPEYVKIMPIKIFGVGGSLPWSRFHEISQAIYFSVDNGADVINMSLGIEVAVAGSNGQEFMDLKSALQYAVDQGVIVSVAAGNSNIELNEIKTAYPARFGFEIEGVVTVGAYDATARTISPFSNFSPTYVEVQAPGSMNTGRGLVSTYLRMGYEYIPGTSMATPLVSGLAALVKIYLKKQNLVLTASQIEGLIKETALTYQSLAHLAQEGRVINYQSMINRLVQIYNLGIIQHPNNLRLRVGQRGRLVIKMDEYSSNLRFQWYHKGQAIEGANQIEFFLKNAKVESEGDYYVEVQLESGEILRSLSGAVEILSDDFCF